VEALKSKTIFYDIWRSEGNVFFTIIPPSPTTGRWRVQPPAQFASTGISVEEEPRHTSAPTRVTVSTSRIDEIRGKIMRNAMQV
jgi:hypothetical protein